MLMFRIPRHPSFKCSMLKSRMLQVFDLAVSRQLAAKGIRILRLKRKTSKTCVDDLFTRSYRRFAELLTKSNRVLRKGESPSVHGLRQDGIRQWLDISHAICARKPLSVLLARERALESDMCHCSHRFHWSVRHRFARMKCRRIEISRVIP
jgi:hypothetical protein